MEVAGHHIPTDAMKRKYCNVLDKKKKPLEAGGLQTDKLPRTAIYNMADRLIALGEQYAFTFIRKIIEISYE